MLLACSCKALWLPLNAFIVCVTVPFASCTMLFMFAGALNGSNPPAATTMTVLTSCRSCAGLPL